jgi:hypothetical protein
MYALRRAGAEHGISTMIGERIRGHAAGQGWSKMTEKNVRLEARRALEQHHTRVGMPEPEDRFAATLW